MGKEYTFCEIREKDVINVVDGRSLGRAVDIAFTCRGQVFGIIVPGNTKFLKGLTSNDSLFIPWRNVIKIGTPCLWNSARTAQELWKKKIPTIPRRADNTTNAALLLKKLDLDHNMLYHI